MDIEKFLKMDPVEFDQSENGWRSLDGNADEEDIANLILKYIEANQDKIDQYNKGKVGKEVFPVSLLYFHAGQSFGHVSTEHYKMAVECFKKSYDEKNECWNAYVNGTIAFLENDRDEVERQIKVVESSKSENKRGGNIAILKNFSKYLEQGIKDYEQAYSMPQES